MAVSRGTVLDDLEGLVNRDELLSLQGAAKGLNGWAGHLREVGQCARPDLAPFAIALAKQDGRR